MICKKVQFGTRTCNFIVNILTSSRRSRQIEDFSLFLYLSKEIFFLPRNKCEFAINRTSKHKLRNNELNIITLPWAANTFRLVFADGSRVGTLFANIGRTCAHRVRAYAIRSNQQCLMKIVSFAPNYRRLNKQTARETNRRDKYSDDEDEQQARKRAFNQAALCRSLERSRLRLTNESLQRLC